MAKEEIKAILDEFAVAAVEHSRTEAIVLVNRLLASVGPKGMTNLLYRMSVGEALNFGRTLSAEWEASNADNADEIEAQKAVLAKILTLLINAGTASIMGEMN